MFDEPRAEIICKNKDLEFENEKLRDENKKLKEEITKMILYKNSLRTELRNLRNSLIEFI